MIGVFNRNLKGTPARVWFDSAIVELEPTAWFLSTPSQRKFMLLHEQGHYRTQSSNEATADDYAQAEYLREHPTDFYAGVRTLEKHLPKNDIRLRRIKQQALMADLAATGNPEAAAEIQKMQMQNEWTANFTGDDIKTFAPPILLIVILITLLILKR